MILIENKIFIYLFICLRLLSTYIILHCYPLYYPYTYLLVLSDKNLQYMHFNEREKKEFGLVFSGI